MSENNNLTIAIAGNPNCGKSSIFNHLTGLRQKTGNFPGITVEKKVGATRLSPSQKATLIDLPGTYSLHPTSADERIVLNILTNPDDAHYPDAVIYVADVTSLEKHFLLLTQILDLGFPTVLALNMTDLAKKEGITVDIDRLEKFLGIPVVSVSGRLGVNMDLLKNKAFEIISNPPPNASRIFQTSDNEQLIAKNIQALIGNGTTYRALLITHHFEKIPFLKKEEKEEVRAVVKKEGFHALRTQIGETMRRYNFFTPVLRQAIRQSSQKRATLTDKLDAILVHKIFGPIIFFFLMFLVFQAIYSWAEHPMNWIETGFGLMADWVKTVFPAGWLTSLITDGILAGLGGIMVFIPQIAILFFLISILEEAGYMARAVFMFDKIMQQFGLNGRSIVALVSGGACAIPAIMSTRTIGNWKERLITILVTPLISCSARIPVYTILIGFVVPPTTLFGVLNLQGLAFMGLYVLGIVAALFSAFVFKKILRSEEGSFLMLELPPYRPPLWKNIALTLKEKVGAFIIEAGKVIMIISMILWFLASYGPKAPMDRAEAEALTIAKEQALDETETADLLASKKIEASFAGHLGKFIEPAIAPLGYDWKIGIALITSFAAREVFVGTMATIYSIGSSDDGATVKDHLAKARHPVTGVPIYTLATSLSLLIFYVFAMQCMSTLAVVRRETGSWKWALIQFGYMSGMAYLGGFLVYQFFK